MLENCLRDWKTLQIAITRKILLTNFKISFKDPISLATFYLNNLKDDRKQNTVGLRPIIAFFFYLAAIKMAKLYVNKNYS